MFPLPGELPSSKNYTCGEEHELTFPCMVSLCKQTVVPLTSPFCLIPCPGSLGTAYGHCAPGHEVQDF